MRHPVFAPMSEGGGTNTDRRTHVTLSRHVLTAGMALAVILVLAGCGATGPSLAVTHTQMNVARWWPTATLLQDGRVLVAGGDGKGTAELFDPKTGTFTLTGTMVQARSEAMAVRLSDGRVLIAGGDELGTAELFDPRSSTFAATGSMHEPHWNGTATLLPDGRVLIAGGSGQTGTHGSPTAELYDPATGAFALTGSMNQARELQTATLIPGVGVLIAGGVSTDGARIASAEIYDTATGTFSATGSLVEARSDHTAILLPNRQVLVVGGWADTANQLGVFVPRSAELFDPSTRRFRSISQPAGDGTESATAVSDGRVLIIGSIDAFLYDPSSESFSVIGGGGAGGDTKIQTLLADGRVLVIGGSTDYQDAPGTRQAMVYKLTG